MKPLTIARLRELIVRRELETGRRPMALALPDDVYVAAWGLFDPQTTKAPMCVDGVVLLPQRGVIELLVQPDEELVLASPGGAVGRTGTPASAAASS